jgi:beta-lactamase regulating signal transducer with metallopeptidase domain
MMHTWILQTNALAGEWLGAIARASVQGGAVLLAVWIVDRLFRRLPAQVRVWLWRLAYLKLIVAFLWAAPINLPLLKARPTPQVPLAPVGTQTVRQLEASPVPVPTPAVEAKLAVHRNPLPNAASVLLCLWSLGLGWFVIRLGKDLFAARRLKSASRPVSDEGLLQSCRELSERFRLRREPGLRISDAIASPLVLGAFRPTILLPAALASKASADDLRLMLAHELAHLRRRDLWWVWPAVMGETLFFFHPAIWLARRAWRLAQEIACDDTVVRTTRIPAARYGDMLIGVTAKMHARCSRPILATLGAAETRETLKRRLHAMKFITAADSTKRWAIVTGGAMLVAGALNVLPWRLVAQETRPAPGALPTAEAVAPRATGIPGEPDARSRPGALPPRSRNFGAGGAMMGGSPRFGGGSSALPPADIAPARFEATVFEVQVPENRVAELDAQALESKAGTAQDLAKALGEFGKTKVLYKVDQSVNLYGENITLGSSEPMVTSTRMDSAGNAINSITYQQVGLLINISANAPPPDAKRKGLDTQVNFHLSVLGDSGVELAHNVKAPATRNIELSHSETPRFGRPCVQLNVSAASGGATALPTAYVVRYVFSETKP